MSGAPTGLPGAPASPDWGVPAPPAPGLVARGLVPAAGLLAVAGGVPLAVGRPAVAGAAAVFTLALLGALWFGTGRAPLGALGTRRPSEGEQPRLENLVHGLAGDLGMQPPRLFVYDGPPNAYVAAGAGGALAVSERLLERCTRTELEGLVAHCLLRLRGGLRAERLAVLAVPGAGDPACRSAAADAPAAALTRYPPGLVGALRACEPAAGRWSAFAFAPEGTPPCDPAARAALLADL